MLCAAQDMQPSRQTTLAQQVQVHSKRSTLTVPTARAEGGTLVCALIGALLQEAANEEHVSPSARHELQHGSGAAAAAHLSRR